MNIDDWLDIQGSYNSEYNMTVECSYNLNEISLRLQELLAEHNIDAKTSSKTQKYYREMRKMHHYFDQHPYNL